MKRRSGKGPPWPDAWYYMGLEATRIITKPHISWKANAWHSLPHTSSYPIVLQLLLLFVDLQSLMEHLQHSQIRASSLQCLPNERHQRLRERKKNPFLEGFLYCKSSGG